jgi:hypothetical protein
MTNAWLLAGIASLASLLVLWVPLSRGVSLFLRARIATRPVPVGELEQQRNGASGVDPQALGLLLDRVEAESKRESDAPYSSAFIRDASRQYVMNEYESRYADPMAIYANILPPIGFVGTTIGLRVLFVSMHVANDSLHLSALALALSSSIFALVGYATLEGLRIHLYGQAVFPKGVGNP